MELLVIDIAQSVYLSISEEQSNEMS
jgi:hypothetical protein